MLIIYKFKQGFPYCKTNCKNLEKRCYECVLAPDATLTIWPHSSACLGTPSNTGNRSMMCSELPWPRRIAQTFCKKKDFPNRRMTIAESSAKVFHCHCVLVVTVV